jgi:heterodisulfide reductase subunit C/coenzyme F420-reducing hydrogenase delta subunit
MQQSKSLDPKFKDQVRAEPGGEHLVNCYSCGTCMSTCLVSRVSSDFNPRRVLRMVMLGMRDAALAGPTIWMCSACDLCYPRCPQGIHISELMHAIKNIAVREGYQAPGPVAEVDEPKCSGCTVCVRSCPYQALTPVMKNVDGAERRVSQVDRTLCMACGICAAACPLSAITVTEHSNERIAAQIQEGDWLRSVHADGEPKLLVFNCSWCLRAEADLEAMKQLPSNVRAITIPCSGRIDPLFILLALKEGADGVLVAGCEPGECHYKQGTYIAQGKLDVLRTMFGQMGLPADRVRFAQIGTLERGRLPELIRQTAADLKTRVPLARVRS